jgi:hypothetical protein
MQAVRVHDSDGPCIVGPYGFADRHSNPREWSAEERGRLINQNGYIGEARRQ